jgi:bacteriorhodopsin
MVLIFFLIHLFSMFCIFYVLYFAAKTFKTVELQREVRFSEFAGEFFMLWIFPIGVWILQPKINKMVEEEDEFL